MVVCMDNYPQVLMCTSTPGNLQQTQEFVKLRIVIADDHPEILRALIMILGKEFEIVGIADNGMHLVEEAIASDPDVIVSDVSMPLLTGPQAQQELLARGHRIPFVFVSAETASVRGAEVSLVDKLDISDELKSAILDTAAGQVYLSHGALRTRSSSYC